jgi:two-component system, response regulator PdtaR
MTATAAMEATLNPIHVLFVEDEPLISDVVVESLTDQGFVVHAASNAADALRHLASAPVDVLFTDVNLCGGVDGTALARRARELLPGLPVVYASGRLGALDAALRVPGSTFVAKPYAPEVLGRLLATSVRAAAASVPV